MPSSARYRAPTTVTQTEIQATLKSGAQANVVTGRVGGKQTSSFNFFDIPDVTFRTGDADDGITIGADGLTAFGLTNLDIQTNGGADTLTVLSSNLVPPAAGKYEPTGNFQPGDSIPAGTVYEKLAGVVRFDGGTGVNSLVADADADWTLTADALVTGESRIDLANVDDASLFRRAAANRFDISGWMGSLAVDGRGGSDQVVLDAGVASSGTISIADSGSAAGDVDELTVLGSNANDTIKIRRLTAIVNSIAVVYANYEVLRIGGRSGDDTIDIIDSAAKTLIADGGEGSDAYNVFDGVSVTDIRISDSGALPPSTRTPSRSARVFPRAMSAMTTRSSASCGSYCRRLRRSRRSRFRPTPWWGSMDPSCESAGN